MRTIALATKQKIFKINNNNFKIQEIISKNDNHFSIRYFERLIINLLRNYKFIFKLIMESFIQAKEYSFSKNKLEERYSYAFDDARRI